MIAEFAGMGVKRFVALRGDPAAGVGARYQPHPGGYANAAELVDRAEAAPAISTSRSRPIRRSIRKARTSPPTSRC